jgi:hypothetical protein
MSKGKIIIHSTWVASLLLLLLFVPKRKVRHAHVSFLSMQFITWFFGLIVAEYNLIEYPTRLFKKATKASFTFEYLIFPSLSTIFNLYYPKNARLPFIAGYYTIFTSFIVGFELIALKYTKFITYNKWKWEFSFITIWLSLHLSWRYYEWFFKHDCNEDVET